jgi:hypothetical protein
LKIPEYFFASLKVYDIPETEIAALTNSEKAGGEYSGEFTEKTLLGGTLFLSLIY